MKGEFYHKFIREFLAGILGIYFLYASQLFAEDLVSKSPPSNLKVRKITVEVLDIFDEPDIELFYRTVNKLKISTKEEVIKQELLIHEGDAYSDFLVRESERNLRSLPFLREVEITPKRDGEFVDLLVHAHDTWTLFPFINFTSGGGSSNRGLGLVEGNLLGYGKNVEFLVAEDEGRQKVEAVWDDRRFLGTKQRLTTGHFERSDGRRTVFSYGKPFRSLVEPDSWNFNGDVSDLVGRLFENSEERYIYRQRHLNLDGGYTFSGGDPEVLLRRYTFGYEYSKDDFFQADADDYDDVNLDPAEVSNDPAELADNRIFSGPYVRYRQIEPDFVSSNFLDRFERVQDFNLGNEFELSLGFAADTLGSLQDTLLIRTSDSDGYRISDTSFVRGELTFSGRATQDEMSQIIGTAQVKYYNILGMKKILGINTGRHTVASALSLIYGEKLDNDFEYLLGAGSGLRGYKDRTFFGDQRLVFNLEDRIHIVEDVLKLFDLGMVFFADAGGISRSGFGDIVSDKLYYDVGWGLRFGLPRSNGGAVIRFDVAFPLRDGPDGSRSLEPRILITSGQLFNGSLRSESYESGVPQVSNGIF